MRLFYQPIHVVHRNVMYTTFLTILIKAPGTITLVVLFIPFICFIIGSHNSSSIVFSTILTNMHVVASLTAILIVASIRLSGSERFMQFPTRPHLVLRMEHSYLIRYCLLLRLHAGPPIPWSCSGGQVQTPESTKPPSWLLQQVSPSIGMCSDLTCSWSNWLMQQPVRVFNRGPSLQLYQAGQWWPASISSWCMTFLSKVLNQVITNVQCSAIDKIFYLPRLLRHCTTMRKKIHGVKKVRKGIVSVEACGSSPMFAWMCWCSCSTFAVHSWFPLQSAQSVTIFLWFHKEKKLPHKDHYHVFNIDNIFLTCTSTLFCSFSSRLVLKIRIFQIFFELNCPTPWRTLQTAKNRALTHGFSAPPSFGVHTQDLWNSKTYWSDLPCPGPC